ncbi:MULTISPECIES: phosphodiesterase [unclassified Sphingomonas]|uniref:phosphodiesterase n=1 Tax=unclassified Sphingomonas TaxID=196159 RepID=UPI001F580A57|nr:MULTISPECIES: phosphodiesterase [unclassified Sphingomonas]
MLIAQITDLHLGFDPGNPDEDNQRRLEAVVARLRDGPNRPDLLLATGDLVDRGAPESYARVKAALGALPFPVHYTLGNHDDRTNFAAAFPETPMPDGFAQYVLERDGLRLVVLDTLEPGRHGGGFCETRAAWLAERLAEDRTTPTVIVMHHPPFEAGIAWMNTHPDEPWVKRFADALAGHDQVFAIWCGHIHRAIVAPWRGKTVTICPSSSAELTLVLDEIDPERPDGRSMVIDGPPGLAWHRWTKHGLVTLFDTVESHDVLASYTERMQPLVRHLAHERPH